MNMSLLICIADHISKFRQQDVLHNEWNCSLELTSSTGGSEKEWCQYSEETHRQECDGRQYSVLSIANKQQQFCKYRVGSTRVDVCWQSWLWRMYWVAANNAATLRSWTSRQQCLYNSILLIYNSSSQTVSTASMIYGYKSVRPFSQDNTCTFQCPTKTGPKTKLLTAHDSQCKLVKRRTSAALTKTMIRGIKTLKPRTKIHRESKKQDTKLLAITSLTIIRFSKFFH